MDKVKIMFSIATHHLRKWFINPRIYLIFTIMILYLYSKISPVNTFCMGNKYKITPYIFSFLMSDPNSVLIIMLGIVLLFCDAPFIEIDQPYMIMRSGRTLWVLGQIAYIVIASIVYFFIVVLFTMLILLPNLEFSIEWGKVIGTFAQTDVVYQHGITIPFDFSIYNVYTPLRAMFFSFLNCWLVSVFLGTSMFVLNLNSSRSAGTIGAALLVLWQMVVTKTWTGFTRFSPVTWVSLSKIDTNGSTLYPTGEMIYIAILTIIAVLILLSVYSMKKRDINIHKPI